MKYEMPELVLLGSALAAIQADTKAIGPNETNQLPEMPAYEADE